METAENIELPPVEAEKQTKEEVVQPQPQTPKQNKREASWPSVLFYIHLNILGLYGILILFTQTSITTVLFSNLLFNV